jgi:hypothetical protein
MSIIKNINKIIVNCQLMKLKQKTFNPIVWQNLNNKNLKLYKNNILLECLNIKKVFKKWQNFKKRFKKDLILQNNVFNRIKM